MSGTLALAKAEISRLRRNKRYMIFTVALPVMFYLIFGKQKAQGYQVSFAAFYMVGMASFGAFSGALNNNAMRISQERKDGWVRQLRLTPLPASAYVVAKVLASMATTVPSILVVFLLGRFYSGVLRKIGEFTPTYQIVKLSTDIIRVGSVALVNVVGVAIWLAIFVALATWAVRGTAETV